MCAGRVGAGSAGGPVAAVRVLIVEDDADSRRGMEVSLGSQGYELATAKNASEAIAQAKAVRPDIVLLDLGLPGIDGIQVLEQLRLVTPEALIVVLSAWDETRYERAALDAGAILYLEKPITSARLTYAIESLLE